MLGMSPPKGFHMFPGRIQIITQLALPIEMEITNYVENACMYV